MQKMSTMKQGFTLVELMVVAIIVAILAAVAVPLMSGNRERAMATEAMAACSMIDRCMRIDHARNGRYTDYRDDITALPGIDIDTLNGTYFKQNNYQVRSGNAQGFNIRVWREGDGSSFDAPYIHLVRSPTSKEWRGTYFK